MWVDLAQNSLHEECSQQEELPPSVEQVQEKESLSVQRSVVVLEWMQVLSALEWKRKWEVEQKIDRCHFVQQNHSEGLSYPQLKVPPNCLEILWVKASPPWEFERCL